MFKNKKVRFIISKLALAGTYLVTVILYTSISKEPALILFAIFASKFLFVLGLGAQNGYFKAVTYNKTGKANNEEINLLYTPINFVHLFSLTIIFILIFCFFNSYIAYSLFVFLSLIWIYSLEPTFRVNGIAEFSLLPDVIQLTSLLLTTCLILVGFNLNEPLTFIIFIYTSSITLFVLIGMKYRKTILHLVERASGINGGRLKTGAKKYMRLIYSGYSTTIVLILNVGIITMDRVFMTTYASQELISEYILSFQIASGPLIIISSIAFIGMVDIGKRIKNDTNNLYMSLKRKLIYLFSYVTATSFFLYIIISPLMSFISKSYTTAPYFSALASFGYGSIVVASCFSPILMYQNKMLKAALVGLVFFAFMVGCNYLAWKGYIVFKDLAMITSATQFAYSLFIVLFSLQVLKKLGTEPELN